MQVYIASVVADSSMELVKVEAKRKWALFLCLEEEMFSHSIPMGSSQYEM